MHRIASIFAGLALAQAANDSGAQIYRCEQNGKFSFSDQPCKAGTKATQKDYAPSNAGVTGSLDLQVVVIHYAVQGRDYESLVQSLKANGPKGFHGLARWKISYEYTTKRLRENCQVDSVKLTVVGDILMPKWADEAGAPPDLQRRWATYYAALKQHEDGHIQHGRELALLVKERMLGLGAVPCEQVKALTDGEFLRIYGNLKTRDQDYDARTNHGATQGALF